MVQAALPPKTKLHLFRPGDWVLIGDLQRTSWNEKWWNGPFQVLLTIQTGVKVEGVKERPPPTRGFLITAIFCIQILYYKSD